MKGNEIKWKVIKYDLCDKPYKQIGQFGTNKNQCLNLSDGYKCEVTLDKCMAVRMAYVKTKAEEETK